MIAPFVQQDQSPPQETPQNRAVTPVAPSAPHNSRRKTPTGVLERFCPVSVHRAPTLSPPAPPPFSQDRLRGAKKALQR